MTGYDVKRLALVLAVQADIEGMKVTNAGRESQGHTHIYTKSAFDFAAEKLRVIAYKHDQEL